VLLVIVKTFLSLFSRDNAAELFPELIIVPTNVKTFSSLSLNFIDVPLLPGLPLSALLRLPVIEKVFLLLPLLKKISLEPLLITDILPSTVISLLVLASNCKPIVPDTLPLSLMLSSVMVLESERRSKPIPLFFAITKSSKLRIESSAAAST